MILTLLLWLTLGWFLGIFVYLTAGFVTLPVDKPGWTHAAADYYTKVAQKLIGRSALIERGTKWDIVSTTHDAGKNADTFDLDGDRYCVDCANDKDIPEENAIMYDDMIDFEYMECNNCGKTIRS